MINKNYFQKLQEWYRQQCNGDWEHEFGVKIDTIDNPGWSLEIDLIDTDLEGKEFSQLIIDYSEDNWIRCWVEDNKFQGGGGPLNLEDLIRIFIDWKNKKPNKFSP